VARVLIVGCGCRGQGLARALAAEGHAVRGTTRNAARVGEIEAAGAEAVVADPDRLATLTPAIENVAVVCWLMGTTSDDPNDPLHGHRLASMLEHIVDTPVRGFVYETGGAHRPPGIDAASHAARTYAMPVEVLDTDPSAHDAWLSAAKRAVERVLLA
jgi:nucleoside-diphosphate-sugar epimerase